MPEPATRSLLALDFDGVICNSLREVFAVAVAAFAELSPRSRLLADLGEDPLAAPANPIIERFSELVPLGNRAEDFGIALSSLDAGVQLPDQDAYDAYAASLPGRFLEEYHQSFYRHRAELRRRDLDSWLALHTPYPAFLDILRAHPPTVTLAIATAKDRASVRLLLEHFDIGGLFVDELILDKETARTKDVHLELLGRRCKLPAERISFVDDKLNHLERVAPLGVRPILAAWGYNSAREQDAARARGFAVASLADAAQILFAAP